MTIYMFFVTAAIAFLITTPNASAASLDGTQINSVAEKQNTLQTANELKTNSLKNRQAARRSMR